MGTATSVAETSFRYYVLMTRLFDQRDYLYPMEGGRPVAILDTDKETLDQLAVEYAQWTLRDLYADYTIEAYWPYAQENQEAEELQHTWKLLVEYWGREGLEPEFASYEAWWEERFRAPKNCPPGFFEALARDIRDLFYYVVSVPIDESPQHMRVRLLR